MEQFEACDLSMDPCSDVYVAVYNNPVFSYSIIDEVYISTDLGPGNMITTTVGYWSSTTEIWYVHNAASVMSTETAGTPTTSRDFSSIRVLR